MSEGFLPPKRPGFNPKRPSRSNPLFQKATRYDVFQLSKAMMKTWRVVDSELKYIDEMLDWLALPFYRRFFVARPVRDQGQGANTADTGVDGSPPPGDTSTAVGGDEGPESETEL